VILFVCFIASGVATITGFGLSTLLTPMLLIFFPLKEVVLLVCIVHVFHDIWKLIFFHKNINLRLFIGFGSAAMCASIVSALIFVYWSIDLSPLLGFFLLAYASFLVFNPKFSFKKEWFTIFTTGLITGFVAGIFGIVGAIRSMFLLSFDLDKQSFIATSALISFLINSIRLVTYLSGGLTLTHQALFLLPFLIVVSFLNF